MNDVVAIQKQRFQGTSRSGKAYDFCKYYILIETPAGTFRAEIKPADSTGEDLMEHFIPEYDER